MREGQRGVPKKCKHFLGCPLPRIPKPARGQENAPISERPKRKFAGRSPGSRYRATMMVQNYRGRCGKDRQACRPGALKKMGRFHLSVLAPVMSLFGQWRDSLFVKPFKQVTKAPCKFRLLQGACCSPVVCSAPLFLSCNLQRYRAATVAAA